MILPERRKRKRNLNVLKSTGQIRKYYHQFFSNNVLYIWLFIVERILLPPQHANGDTVLIKHLTNDIYNDNHFFSTYCHSRWTLYFRRIKSSLHLLDLTDLGGTQQEEVRWSQNSYFPGSRSAWSLLVVEGVGSWQWTHCPPTPTPPAIIPNMSLLIVVEMCKMTGKPVYSLRAGPTRPGDRSRPCDRSQCQLLVTINRPPSYHYTDTDSYYNLSLHSHLLV